MAEDAESTGKRARILAAALKHMSLRGYYGTVVPDIAQAAGVGTGTIYRYFADKEGLVNALYQHWQRRYLSDVFAPMPAGLDPRAQFDTFWRRLIAWAQEEPEAAAFLAFQTHPYLDEASLALARSVALAARNFVKSGIASGVLAARSPEPVLAILSGTALGLVKQIGDAHRLGRAPPTAAEIAEAGELVWRAIAAPQEARRAA